MKEAVIVSTARTAVGRAHKGGFAQARPDDLGAAVVSAALERAEDLGVDQVEDVVLGCAFPEAEQGTNVARVIAMRAGLPASVPAMTVNRFCASGLQSIAQAAERIMTGGATAVVAGGLESMSLVPMTGHVFRPNPRLAIERPEVYIAMGHTAERVAERWGVSREDQDAFALRSHQRALDAAAEGRFADEIVPVGVEVTSSGADGTPRTERRVIERDEGPRADTTHDRLASLKPAFRRGGSVTAGNSSQTSDGAAAVVLMERGRAEALGLKPRARFVAYAVVGVEPDVMGIGPVEAVPLALERAGLTIHDIDLFEINEAFAAQAVAVSRQLELDEDRLNVNGGAIALGHPLGATGSRLTVSLVHELERRGGRYGLVSMCIGGGMGAAGIFERLD